MIDRVALLGDLKAQVRALEDDLRERAGEVEEFDASLRAEWRDARDAERIAATYETWLDDRVTQSAVAWVLGTVFLRFCEDNELIDLPYLAGPGERLTIASERQQAYFEQPENRQHTDREWIVAGFDAMAKASPVAGGLYDRRHNPMWRITPSLDAAKALIAFWRRRGDDGELVHDFTDPEWNTRFLGDLYQDLSEHAKKTYALLQTPEFVEEFILDLTLDPAIEEFGLEPEPPNSPVDLPRGLRVIDPTCGSGHFLLGAFKRLLKAWELQAPNADRWDLINRVLYSVHGVDKNPAAVAIARFRLLLAAMQAGKVACLADAPTFTLNLAVGDSLIHGRGQGEQGELFSPKHGKFTFTTEDVGEYMKTVDILGVSTYHVVAGNPPYITAKEKCESDNYRKAYRDVCSGIYPLSVPFAKRFFRLARRAGGDRRTAGYVGQITANSFMKREFGKKLIENFFAQQVNLTHIIDTSGCHIPEHGTPTIIIIGRNMIPGRGRIRSILGIRGEPEEPADPAEGNVWRSIHELVGSPEAENEWVSVSDLDRLQFSSSPWNLNGGSVATLERRISYETLTLSDKTQSIGYTGQTNSDDAFLCPAGTFVRIGMDPRIWRPFLTGDDVRDFDASTQISALFPYLEGHLIDIGTNKKLLQWMWPNRTSLWARATFGRSTYRSDGRPWWEWHQVARSRLSGPGITWPFVQTHNHFVYLSEILLHNRHAPVIQLTSTANENDYFGLLGLLNSSTACFWMKQVSQPKGGSGIGRGVQDEPWEDRYEFPGTSLGNFPVPVKLPQTFGRELHSTGQQLIAMTPSALISKATPIRNRLEQSRTAYKSLHGRMIALQEELDWEVYRLYALLTNEEAAELLADPHSAPELKLGERAFEIVLARKIAADDTETQWFTRHESTPTTKLPEHWPEEYKRVVERRIEAIEKMPRTIGLIERPEYKRRWQTEPWEKKEKAALRNWLLDRCEDRALWFTPDDTGGEQPQPMTVNRLADKLRGDADFVSVARLYAGQDADLADVIAEITETEHVPYLAALRYKDTGLRKRAQWEKTWDLQREEDADNKRLDIPVPPKYASADFLKTSYWRNRGKLDVPKERFISYPGASPDGDGSLLLGWAGWDHREQAHALMTLIEDRTTRHGWDKEGLTPLIAGLSEVLPWVKQWHGDIDPEFGMSPADAYTSYLEDQQLRHGLTADDLTAWRPPRSARGRRRTAPR